ESPHPPQAELFGSMICLNDRVMFDDHEILLA
ncbi:MAG: hypothetical protein RL693_2793, partial [Verrucomicrobiota bacterium]